jgi:hypothetical protein
MLALIKPSSARFFSRAFATIPIPISGLSSGGGPVDGLSRAFSTPSTSSFPNPGAGSSPGPAVSGGGPLDGRERALERDWAQRRDRELLDALVRAQAGTQRHEQKGDLKTILARHGVDESSSPGLLQALLTWQANILNPLLNLTAYSPKADK